MKKPVSKNCSFGAKELDRLRKLCGMFSSFYSGERENAAAKADELLRKHGLTWPDVLRAPVSLPPGPDEPIATWARRQPAKECDDPFAAYGGFREAAAFCAGSGRKLTKWERNFCTKLMTWAGSPSEKELEMLGRLLDRAV